MASVKVKFRNSTVAGRKGTVYYQICHAGSHINITTKYKVEARMWDKFSERLRVIDGDGTAEYYNRLIESDLSVLSIIITDLESTLLRYTVGDIARRYRENTNTITVAQYMHQRIRQMESSGRYSTALNYQSALSSFSNFIGHGNVSMSVFNNGVVNRYSQWLTDNHVSRNSLSFYMRILRAVYNAAVKEKIVVQTHPFADVYTGVDRTRKRALPEDTLKRLFGMHLDKQYALRMVRDMFLFSYCTRGMAFVDMAFLQKNNIRGNSIVYRRRKTSQTISVRIEPCIRSIIDRYGPQTEGTPYVFPIITSDNERDAYRQYRVAIGNYNRMLKILARKAGISENLSSYTSRHSWATAARNHNIPISVISAGMGHTSQLTTEIYLASIENSVIDDANKSLLQDIDKYVI